MLTRTTLEDLIELGQPLHVALGVFDGVHVGHQQVLARAVAAAKQDGGLAGMITFHPHPCRAVRPDRAPAPILVGLEHKERILKRMGLDVFVPIAFDEDLAQMEAQDFLQQLLDSGVKTIAVGDDWRFGKDRLGDVAMLERESERCGYRLEVVSAVKVGGERVSSTRIRQAIVAGEMVEVEQCLGRPYALGGRVVKGEQLGRTIGYPTANLDTAEAQLPPNGVWLVSVRMDDGRNLPGIANLGQRPTVGGLQKRLEVHLLDFSEDLYGKFLEVEFSRWLRAEQKFSSLDALKEQLRKDEAAARACL